MTKENNFELIEYLSDELFKECEKQGISFALSINASEDIVIARSGGNAFEVAECIIALQQQIEEETNLPFKLIEVAIKKETDFKTIDSEQDNLFRFLTALFSMKESGDLDD
ncbi:hypothetical protein JNUCC83_05440 [Vagococcus sp. JNUCC 83]